MFGHFDGWPSIDWLGNSVFSQGGGFFPVKNKDATSTVLYVPLNQTGTYTILTHSTLFAGNSTTEPITLAAKFTNISSEIILDSQNNLELESTIIDNESEIIPTPNNDTLVVSKTDYVSEFDIGLVIGIIVGIAIQTSLLLIFRQKNT